MVAGPVDFAPAEASRPDARTVLRPGDMQRRLTRDFLSGEQVMEVVVDDGLQRIDAHGLEVGRRCVERYFAHPDDPQSLRVEADWTMTLARGDWSVRTETRATMRRRGSGFSVDCLVEAFEGDTQVFQRRYGL